MLYLFILDLIESYSFLNVFKYLTVRTGLAVFTSLFVVFLIGNPFIKYFSINKIVDPIREDGPNEHIVKDRYTDNGGFVNISWFIFWHLTMGRSHQFICMVFNLYSR